MDETFGAGDIIAYRLHGDAFGVARVLHVQELALHRYFHLAILDAVLDDEDGIDSYGAHQGHEEEAERAGEEPVFIDHIALMPEAFAESGPVLLDHRPVEDEEMGGYGLWLQSMRNELLRSGMIQQFVDEPEEEEEESVDDADEHDDATGEIDGESAESEEETESVDDFPDEDSDASLEDVEPRPWHFGVYSRPLAELMFDGGFRLEFAKPEMRHAAVAQFINSFFDGNNIDAINEMVQGLVDGDYAAGQGLVEFGDAAADALGEQLQGEIAPQLADDILNILCDMGSMRAYEHIATFFANHSGPLADDLGLAAARGFCYAVMLTGGTPEPLHRHLARLDDILYPDLQHDVASAKHAAAAAAG